MRGRSLRFWFLAISLAGLCLVASPLRAQLIDQLGGGLGGQGLGQETVVTVEGQFTAPTDASPAHLFVTAKLAPGWHIYSITQAPGGPKQTKIKLDPSKAYQRVGDFRALSAPEKKKEGIWADPNLITETHHTSVTWYAPIKLTQDVDPASLRITGQVYAQACSTGCLMPQDYPFTAVLGPGMELPPEGPAVGPPQDAQTGSDTVPVFDPAKVETRETVQAKSMAAALGFAFLGGLILNVMPCVLPVIGLKILAFFEQAGQSRRRAFVLNLWYSLGLVSVFLVLAALGVGLSRMFTQELFGITMAAIVFVMALSLMGVWELRVPSFLGSGKTLELAEKEGALGAFFKGIITTLLAIPCGAPLLSPALEWANAQVKAGNPQNVYLAFAVIGLGMASPYLVIGAFPELLRFLPKPGPWMETFQKTMGYLLLVAVVWILYFLPLVDVVPTIGLLFGLWFACWMIGRVPITGSAREKIQAWGLALGVAGLAALISFPLVIRPAMQHRVEKVVARGVQEGRHDEAVFQRLASLRSETAKDSPKNQVGGGELQSVGGLTLAGVPRETASDSDDEDRLPWQPFSRAMFEQLVAAKKTVLVDFTADWCLTCKTLERLVLNSRAMREAVDRNGVVTLQADWTDGAAEVTEMLEILGSKQVPVVAIFPAGDPNRPIVFRGGFTQKNLIAALEEAGPSRPQL